MTMRLLSVCELRRSCVKEIVALGVPLRGNSQTKSSEVILREQRRRWQEGLQTHLKTLMDCSCRDSPPTPRQNDKHTFNESSSTFTPFADKDLQRCWACLDSSGFEERGRSKLLQHPSNSSITFNSLWNTVDKKRLLCQCWTLPLTKPSSALTSTWESSALRPSHHLAFSVTQLTTFCLARISSISCTIQLMGRCSNRTWVTGAIGRVML